MDASEIPLSELDLYCDWPGDPNDPVEVRMTVEVYCTPGTTIPVLNTCFPVIRVKAASIKLAEPKPDVIEELRRPSYASGNGPLQTPERQTLALASPPRIVSSPLIQNDSPSLPDTGSVIVHSDTETSGPSHKTVLADSYQNLVREKTPNVTPTSTPNSRKRNAKAASLPDSVTDSERGYGGTKHKTRPSCSDPQSPVISLKHSSKPSMIPRPVSSLNHQTEPAKVPLPTDSAPVSVADFDRFEGPLSIPEEKTVRDKLDENRVADASPLVSTEDIPNDNPDLALTKREQDMEKLSTVVLPGTPCDINNSPISSTSSIGSPADEVIVVPRSSPPVPIFTSTSQPHLIIIDNRYNVHTPATAMPSKYSVTITFWLHLQRGWPKGWWNVVFPDLPRLQHNECGYVYFWFPADQGIEIRTTHLKRYSLNQACMMGQFPLPLKLSIPLRLCDGRFYGFLRDFKVTHTIRAEVIEEDDLRTCRVKYVAVCSIDLIQRDFWAEKCGVSLFVHGGPEGDFTCNLQPPQGQFQTIHLESGPGTQPGISSLQVICSPLSLVSLAITWEVELPRERVSAWMPRIKSTSDMDDVEYGLQSEWGYAEEQRNFEVTSVDALAKPGSEAAGAGSRWRRFKRTWFSRKWRRVLGLVFLLLLGRLLYRAHAVWCPYSPAVARVEVKAMSVLEVDEVAIAEDTPVVEDASDTIDDAADTDGVARINGTATVNDAAEVEDVSTEIDDVIKVEDLAEKPVVPSPSIPTPSMSIRDRIDYLLGWRGPLGEL